MGRIDQQRSSERGKLLPWAAEAKVMRQITEKDVERAKRTLESCTERAKCRALLLAQRSWACLNSERQAQLRAFFHHENPELVLFASFRFLREEAGDLLEIESRLQTVFPWTLFPLLTRITGLIIAIGVEIGRLRHAREMFEIKRRLAGDDDAAAEQIS